MKEIDWSKAPEWAVEHGLNAFNGEIHQYWIGEDQYQRLDHAKAFPYGGMGTANDGFHNHRRHEFKYVTQRPAPWSGEGLPPAGVRCEDNQGDEVVIVAHHINGTHAIYAESLTEGILYYGEAKDFRPVRTPEQIAAEEREKAVKDLFKIMTGHENMKAWAGTGYEKMAELIHEAGYRKQVQP